MSDVVGALLRGEALEQAADCGPEVLDGAFGRIAKQAFELGERQLDRVEVWTVGRQIDQARTGSLDGLAHAAHLVRAEVIEHHDVAWLEFLDQELLDVGEERRSVDRAVQHQRSNQAGCAQAGQEGGCVPMAVRDDADQALAPWCPAACAGHVGRGPGFIEEDKARWIESELARRPLSARFGGVLAPLFLGLQVLFLYVRPSRATTFHITE